MTFPIREHNNRRSRGMMPSGSAARHFQIALHFLFLSMAFIACWQRIYVGPYLLPFACNISTLYLM